ncbi:MAG: sensor histidine kinase, partial [Xanthomonadales bacterium]|nr:sensor histidine kinase [Xanthomonadales bacterium]
RLDAVGPEQAPVFGIVRSVELGSRTYRLEVYGPASPVLQELSAFDRMLFWIVLSLVALLLLASVLQSRFALQPLARLRAAMSAVEQGEADVIGSGFGPDLDPMARELDGLLKRNAQIVERARGHAADLAHALKKPLALLRSEADATRAVPADLVQRESASMARLIDRHLARAGSGAGDRRRIDVFQHVNALVDLMRQLHRARGIDWEMSVPEALSWRGEATDLEEMLGNLLDNAGKWASHQVRVTAVSTPAGIEVAVDDDGPGLSAEQRARATQRWQRFDESVPGTGLGLGITADIATTYEGEMALLESSLGGLRVVLNLPQ